MSSRMSSAPPSWKNFFTEGISHFRHQEIDEALQSFDKAISLANDKSYVLYDSRASAYEKKNRLKDALWDAKKTIDIAPKQWHGYFRSARLFAALGQNDAALRMCSSALERLGDDSKHEARRGELMILRRHLDSQTKCLVSGLPVELLLTIFKFSNNPVVISHVCRRWREVALPQSTLWYSLELAAPGEKAILKVHEWKKRSRGQITELNIRHSLAEDIFPSRFYSSLNPDARALYAKLLATLRHLDWTKLNECHMEGVEAQEVLFEVGGSTAFRHMETLSAWCQRVNDVRLGRPRAEFAKIPWKHLRALSITNAGCDWKQLSMSMHHLTSFEYKSEAGEFAHFHRFLQVNPGLEKLVIESAFNNPLQAPYPLTLVHLHHLELSGDSPFHVKAGNFSLPSLRILRMTRLKIAASMLSELIQDEGTSFAELIELTARGCTLGPQILTSVLLRTPKLETLNCTGDVVNDVADSLTKPCMALLRSDHPELVPTALPILCPALSVLDLSQSARLKTGSVMRIVKERIALATSQDGGRYQLPGDDGDREVSCIRVLKVDECPHIEAEMLPWFRDNVPQFSCRYELKKRKR